MGTSRSWAGDTLAGIVAEYQNECERSRLVVLDASLEDRARGPDMAGTRWLIWSRKLLGTVGITIFFASRSTVRSASSWTTLRSVMFGSPKFLKVFVLHVF